jgi:hypothetical protein
MVALFKVKLPTVDVVLPSVIVALPSVAVLFAKKLLGKVDATELIVTLANVILPKEVCVDPNETDVFPIVTALFAK